MFRQACASSTRRFRPRSCISRCVVGLSHLAQPGFLSREVELVSCFNRRRRPLSFFYLLFVAAQSTSELFCRLVRETWHPSPVPGHQSRLLVLNHPRCHHPYNFPTTTQHYAALCAGSGRRRRRRSSKGTSNSTNGSRCARGAVVTVIILLVLFVSPAATWDTLPRTLLTSATTRVSDVSALASIILLVLFVLPAATWDTLPRTLLTSATTRVSDVSALASLNH